MTVMRFAFKIQNFINRRIYYVSLNKTVITYSTTNNINSVNPNHLNGIS